MKCMIVDDEPLARRVIEKHMAVLPSLKLVKECSNAMAAAAYLHEHPVDVMFLDIKMPELTGLDFLKTLSDPPLVILTTAYSEFALEGYEYSVVDYLLKPISFERFLKAVNKVSERVEQKKDLQEERNSEVHDGFIFLRADKIEHKVMFSEIRYIEGCGNFVKVYTANKMIMVSETMSNIQERLPENLFIRVHKSYVVSITRMDCIESNMIRIGEKVIPIGKTYKREVERAISKYRFGERS
ncbi:MAG: response regulator transcription factor [Gemmatimonadota bacterium]|nr:MAG: response regulator transcription factor [Gemmatimonadota bacterium]